MDGFNSFRATVCAIRIRRSPIQTRSRRRVQFTYQDTRTKMLQGIRMRFFDKKRIKP